MSANWNPTCSCLLQSPEYSILNTVQYVPLIKTAEEDEREIVSDYKVKLEVGRKTLPDPFGTANCWLNEEDGTVFWPVILYTDIHNFLAFHPNELSSDGSMIISSQKVTATTLGVGYHHYIFIL